MKKSTFVFLIFLVSLFSIFLNVIISPEWFSSPIWLILFFVIPGIAIFFHGLKQLKMSIASKNWPIAMGKIICSGVLRNRGVYRLDLEYKYTVNGNKYLSNKVSFGHWDSSSQRKTQKIVNRYTTGKCVTVYYDPHNPKNAVLEPGANLGVCQTILFGGIFAGCGLLFWGPGL